jgi:hypothetical protein
MLAAQSEFFMHEHNSSAGKLLHYAFQKVLEPLCDLLCMPAHAFEKRCVSTTSVSDMFMEQFPITIAPRDSRDPLTRSVLCIDGVNCVDMLQKERLSAAVPKNCLPKSKRRKNHVKMEDGHVQALTQVRRLSASCSACL